MASRKRLGGPAESLPLARIPRVSGRDPLRQRKNISQNADQEGIFLRTGLLTQAQGSAYLELGKIKIAAACYGPKTSTPGPSGGTRTLEEAELKFEFKFASFSMPQRTSFVWVSGVKFGRV